MPKPTMLPQEFGGLSLIGGHPGLNFLNTVKYRGHLHDGDRLELFSDIVKWAYVAGILDEKECNVLSEVDDQEANIKRLHREICGFREQARIVIEESEKETQQFEKAVQNIERAITRLRPRATINPHTGGLEKSIPIEKAQDLKCRIIFCFADLLENRPLLSIKSCNGSDCDWVFIDRTKAKRRQWCDTRTCGNTARVRRFRAEQKVVSNRG